MNRLSPAPPESSRDCKRSQNWRIDESHGTTDNFERSGGKGSESPYVVSYSYGEKLGERVF
jgi:hypothetical protein